MLRANTPASDNTVLCKLSSKAGFRSHLYVTDELSDIHSVAKCEDISRSWAECLWVVVAQAESCYEYFLQWYLLRTSIRASI